ncbi:Glycine-rich RNA-binding protein 4, mitochondrial [Smittium culicis]|uniref:Glycine-rich RNA-binding protein 4, mitochondrial n=1 Tax=Smittium culicis TaxID=133412 RepID=A0A1R1XEM0_9FUNG|nr:Glycine-rich RNA-binding protein 4, mitochondrial [Smittium culicis]
MSAKVFVGSLSWGTTSESLREKFEEFGTVEDSIVIQDRDTGRSRGYGFVTFSTNEEAQAAIDQANESEFDGRNIRVSASLPRESGGGSGGYRGGRGDSRGGSNWRRNEGGNSYGSGGRSGGYGGDRGERGSGSRSYGSGNGGSYGSGGRSGGYGGERRGNGGGRSYGGSSYNNEESNEGGNQESNY